MEKEQSINLLIKAVELAQSRGVYTLQDAVAIANAISVLTTPIKEEEEIKED